MKNNACNKTKRIRFDFWSEMSKSTNHRPVTSLDLRGGILEKFNVVSESFDLDVVGKDFENFGDGIVVDDGAVEIENQQT